MHRRERGGQPRSTLARAQLLTLVEQMDVAPID